MNKETILGIVRHILTTAGGVLVTKGVTDDSNAQAIVGGIIAAIGVIWSIVQKKRAA
jgi:hypothetical protein